VYLEAINHHANFLHQDDESSERDSGTGDSKRSYDNMEHVVDNVIHSFLAARGEGWSISPPPPSLSDLGTEHAFNSSHLSCTSQ